MTSPTVLPLSPAAPRSMRKVAEMPSSATHPSHTIRFRVAIVAALGVTIAAIAACGGSSKPAATESSPAPTSTSIAPLTTVDPTAARGLSGLVTTVAGDGTDSGKGIPGPASSAGLGAKVRFAVTPNGDLFLTTGTVDVVKLTGGQLSVFAQLEPSNPGLGGVAIAPDGGLYVTTPSNVFKFASDGSKTLVLNAQTAGVPTSLGPIAVDKAGNLFVVDGSPRITKVAPDGSTTVIAGIMGQAPANTAPGDGGPATAAALGAVTQLAFDGDGNLLIADTVTHRIRRIGADGIITTIAGGGTTKLASATGQFAPDGTKPTDLELAEVVGLAVDAKGRVYVADSGAEAMFRFAPGAGIEFVAGSQKGGSETAGLPANQTRLRNFGALAFDAQGNLFFSESLFIRRLAGAGI